MAVAIILIVLIALAILGYMLEDPATSNSPHAREQREKERKLRREEWLQKVADRELEMELEDMIYRGRNYDMIRQEVVEAFTEIHQADKIEDMMCLHPEDIVLRYGKSVYTKKQRENIAAAHRENVRRVMMANRGKLLGHDAWAGIPSWGYGAPTVLMGYEWNEESADFVSWIDAKLREKGIQETLYVTTLLNEKERYVLVGENRKRPGTYKWEPALD